MQTFGQQEVRVANALQIPSDASYSDRINKALDWAYNSIWHAALWPGIHEQLTVSVSSGSTTFAISKRYTDISSAVLTGPNVIVPVVDNDEALLNNTEQGVNNLFEIARYGIRGALTQLTVSGVNLKVLSTVSTDVSVAILCRGTNANGEVIEETITTDATDSSATVTGSASFATIERVSKGVSNTAGVISIKNTGDANTNATIAPYENTATYPQFRIYPAPTAALSLNCNAVKRYERPTNTLSAPQFEMDTALFAGAMTWCWTEHRQFEAAAAAFQSFLFEIGKLARRNNVTVINMPQMPQQGGA